MRFLVHLLFCLFCALNTSFAQSLSTLSLVLNDIENIQKCVVSADHSTLIVSSLINGSVDISLFVNKNDTWMKTKTPKGVNTADHQIIQSIAQDGSSFLYSSKGIKNLKICKKLSEGWSEPKDTNLFYNIKEQNIHSFALTPDGQKIYFSLKNIRGNYDLYSSFKTGRFWSKHIKLSEKVNTDLNEVHPFISPFDQKLYFTRQSEGWSTIFFIEKINTRVDSVKQLLLNTKQSHLLNYTEDASGKTGYVRSLHPTKLWEVNKKSGVELYSIIKGKVVSESKKNKIDNIRIDVFNLSSKKKENYIYFPNPQDNSYIMVLPKNQNYLMSVSAQNFKTKQAEFSTKNDQNTPIDQTITLDLEQKTIDLSVDSSLSPQTEFQEAQLVEIIYEIIDDHDTSAFKNLDQYLNDQNTQTKYTHLIDVLKEIIEKNDTAAFNNLSELEFKDQNNQLTFYYPPNAFVLEKENLKQLNTFLDHLQPGSEINLLGYSDTIGSTQSKQEISKKRIDWVVDYIHKNKGDQTYKITKKIVADKAIAGVNQTFERKLEIIVNE